MFSKIKEAYQLWKNIDMDALGRLSQKIDLPEVMEAVGRLDDQQLAGLMKMLRSGGHTKKELPPVTGDFYDISHKLSEEDRALQLKVRSFMEQEIQPIVNEYWLNAEFPFEVIPKLAELNICGVTYEGYGCPNRSFLMEGIIAMELARVDTSISTFFGVQSGLAWVPKRRSRNGCRVCSNSRLWALSGLPNRKWARARPAA